MIEFWQNFHFLRPWFLLFLLFPCLFYFVKMKKITALSSWEDVCDKNLLDFLLITNGSTKKIPILGFIYTGFIAAALAAAGPAWKKTEIPAFSVENPNMFIISLAQDMQLRDVTPSRLDRAKFMLSDITDNISQGQFGIEVYSQEPYNIIPFTDDIQLVKNILPQIIPDIVPDNGDRLDRAIDLAIERFKTAGYLSGNIILFASDVGQRFDFALEKTKEAAANHFTVHIVDTSVDGNEKLRLLAETGNGVYLNVQETNPHNLTDRINDINQERVRQNNNSRSNYADYGYYLLFIPLFCLLTFFRKGLLVVLLCCFSFHAHAGFLANNNQEGLNYFKQEQYDAALQKFSDFDWRGVTLYKKDQLENALQEFDKSKSSTAIYNKGVILTKLCKYEEALIAFNEAIKADPQNKDALYNKKILEELFAKAKENPDVLNCQNQNDNQQNQNNKSENNQQEQDQQQSKSNQNDEQPDNNQNDNSENNPTQQQDNSNKRENNNSDEKQNPHTDNGESKDMEQQQNSQENSPSQSSKEQNSDTQSPAESSQKNENQNKNDSKSSDNALNEEKSMEETPQLMNAKEGNEDEKYDEEALALQRRYREIPEDIGGLLREFIKKEHMKDRYQNESM